MMTKQECIILNDAIFRLEMIVELFKEQFIEFGDDHKFSNYEDLLNSIGAAKLVLKNNKQN